MGDGDAVEVAAMLRGWRWLDDGGPHEHEKSRMQITEVAAIVYSKVLNTFSFQISGMYFRVFPNSRGCSRVPDFTGHGHGHDHGDENKKENPLARLMKAAQLANHGHTHNEGHSHAHNHH